MQVKGLEQVLKAANQIKSKTLETPGTNFHDMLVESIDKIDNNKEVPELDIKSFLVDSINNVNSALQYADDMNNKLILGETDNLHEVMIATEKAELTLNFAIEVKNKISEAYKEIMRMQV